MRDLRQVQQQRAIVMIEFRGVRFKVGGVLRGKESSSRMEQPASPPVSVVLGL